MSVDNNYSKKRDKQGCQNITMVQNMNEFRLCIISTGINIQLNILLVH